MEYTEKYWTPKWQDHLLPASGETDVVALDDAWEHPYRKHNAKNHACMVEARCTGAASRTGRHAAAAINILYILGQSEAPCELRVPFERRQKRKERVEEIGSSSFFRATRKMDLDISARDQRCRRGSCPAGNLCSSCIMMMLPPCSRTLLKQSIPFSSRFGALLQLE